MSILIKGMNMPKDCRECKMLTYYSTSGCSMCDISGNALARNFKPIPFDGRPDFCPLVEIPEPHGRLIDCNEAKSNMVPLSFSVQKWISEVGLLNCKTIIEAEGSEDE